MTPLTPIEALERQEQELVFESFDEETAHLVGQALRMAANTRKASVAIDIRSSDRRYFYSALSGTNPNNEEWARRKGNVVLRCHASSYLVKMRLGKEGKAAWPDAALEIKDYAVDGGGFPVRVRGSGVIASIAVSGLPSHEDHDIIVSVLAKHLGVSAMAPTPVPDLAV